MAAEWSVLFAICEGSGPIQINYRVFAKTLEWKIDATTRSIPIADSFPRAVEELRKTLSSTMGTLVHFRHCIHCISYECSGMALEMSKGMLGTCTHHKMHVEPLFACDDFFSFWDFRPSSYDGVSPLTGTARLMGTLKRLEVCEPHMAFIYKYGTCAISTYRKPLVRQIRNHKLRLLRRHPQPIIVSDPSKGSVLVQFGRSMICTVIFDEDLFNWRSKNNFEDGTSLFPNPRVATRLGLDGLTQEARMAAILGWSRVLLDAEELIESPES